MSLPRLSTSCVKGSRPRGFTLLEVAVCLLILGLLTGTATLSLRGVKQNVDFETWGDQLTAFDRQTRQRAEQQGRPWQILIDVEDGRLLSQPSTNNASVPRLASYTPGNSGDYQSHPGAGAVLGMPRGWELINATTDDENTAHTTGGQIPVLVSTRGLTPTYVLHLRNENKQNRWLLASGGSGQWIETDDEETVDNIFGALRDTPSHDTD